MLSGRDHKPLTMSMGVLSKLEKAQRGELVAPKAARHPNYNVFNTSSLPADNEVVLHYTYIQRSFNEFGNLFSRFYMEKPCPISSKI